MYKGISKRVKNDTPYFNTLMFIFWVIVVHLFKAIIILKIFKVDLFKKINTQTFLILFILIAALFLALLAKAFPLRKISIIEVSGNDVKKYYNRTIIYFILQVVIMMILLIILKNRMSI